VQKILEIDFCSPRDDPSPIRAVLTAIHLSKFSRKLVKLSISTHKLEGTSPNPGLQVKHGYGQLVDVLTVYPFHIKAVCLSFRQTHVPSADKRGCEPKLNGLHEILPSLKDISSLEVSGCCHDPELRLCDACHLSFVIACGYGEFSHLTTLVTENMYISGGCLRPFIKSHANTLVGVEFSYCVLTDGTWRDVARRLLKITGLQRVFFSDKLYQKKTRVIAMPLPAEIDLYRSNNNDNIFGVTARSVENVRQLLVASIQYFHTTPVNRGFARGGRARLPRYHKLCLFTLRGSMSNKYIPLQIAREFKSYANEVD
jgi:hypothetical protein